MRRLIFAGISFFLIILFPILSFAIPFTNPPDSFITSYPYQRNVLINFTTDPHTWLVDGPDWGPGAVTKKFPDPGNPDEDYHLQGTNDLELYESDYLLWFNPPDLNYIDTDASLGASRQGMIGIYQRSIRGIPVIDPPASFLINLDNLIEPRPIKHIWIEAEYFLGSNLDPSTGFSFNPVLRGVDPSTSFPLTIENEEIVETIQGVGTWYRINYSGIIEPNPPYERISWTFTTGEPQETILFDYIHVATECVVPEPTTMLLFGSGLISLAGLRRRFKKS